MVDSATVLASLAARCMTDETGAIREDFREGLAASFGQAPDARIYDFTKTNMDLRVLITDTAGRVLCDSFHGAAEGEDYSGWRDIRLTLKGTYGARATLQDKNDPESLMFFVAAPVTVNGEIRGVLSVGKPVRSILPFMRKAKSRLIATGLTVVSAVLLLQVLISFWVTKPIRMLTAYARAVRDGRPARRPKLPHSDLGDLTAAFEEMRDALEGRQYVENYVQSLTHEMKSPLAAIRGASELLAEEMPNEQRRRFLRNIQTETQRMHDLIDRLLALAGLEKRKGIESPEPVNTEELAQDVLAGFQPAIEKKKLNIRLTADRRAPLSGDYFLLRQAVANLLQNAVDFSPEGGTVTIEIPDEPNGAVIRIRDEGPGIPDYALNRVFDRFYSLPRPDDNKKGSGLGLNFVQEIAKLHGGTVRLTNITPHGAEATLWIPSAPV
jgi:two-component system sensor histidine kinase CreC